MKTVKEIYYESLDERIHRDKLDKARIDAYFLYWDEHKTFDEISNIITDKYGLRLEVIGIENNLPVLKEINKDNHDK